MQNYCDRLSLLCVLAVLVGGCGKGVAAGGGFGVLSGIASAIAERQRREEQKKGEVRGELVKSHK